MRSWQAHNIPDKFILKLAIDLTKSTKATPKEHAFRCAYFQFIPILNEDKLDDHARQNHNQNALLV